MAGSNARGSTAAAGAARAAGTCVHVRRRGCACKRANAFGHRAARIAPGEADGERLGDRVLFAASHIACARTGATSSHGHNRDRASAPRPGLACSSGALRPREAVAVAVAGVAVVRVPAGGSSATCRSPPPQHPAAPCRRERPVGSPAGHRMRCRPRCVAGEQVAVLARAACVRERVEMMRGAGVCGPRAHLGAHAGGGPSAEGGAEETQHRQREPRQVSREEERGRGGGGGVRAHSVARHAPSPVAGREEVAAAAAARCWYGRAPPAGRVGTQTPRRPAVRRRMGLVGRARRYRKHALMPS